MTLDDLEAMVKKARAAEMDGKSLLYTGATGIRGHVRFLELRDK